MYLKIDGSYGEGGGQILRTSLALSVVLRRPIEVVNIRARRSKPGLRPQHLAGVKALARITDAEVRGDQIGSTSLLFAPAMATPPPATGAANRTVEITSPPATGAANRTAEILTSPSATEAANRTAEIVRSGRYTFDVTEETRSAGAVTLLFQTLALPLACGSRPSEITLRGGTHVAWSPPFPYLSEVLLPILAQMGYRAEVELRSWGWYPRGGGEIGLRVEPLAGLVGAQAGRPDKIGEPQAGPLRSLFREKRGALKAIRGVSAASNLPAHVAERQARRVKERLCQHELPPEMEVIQPPSPGPGSLVFLVAHSEEGIGGFSSLGARGKPAETVADEAVDALLAYLETGCAFEEHLADQLILFLAFTEGPSSFTTSRISRHLLTNLWVIQQFLPVKIQVEGEEGKPGRVSKLGVD